MAEYIDRDELNEFLDGLKICTLDECGKLTAERTKNMIKTLIASSIRSADVAPAPKWISVKDRLPDVPGDGWGAVTVIVTDGKSVRPMRYERAIIRGKLKYRWVWMQDRLYDGSPITHWMPLPKPSKEDKDEQVHQQGGRR